VIGLLSGRTLNKPPVKLSSDKPYTGRISFVSISPGVSIWILKGERVEKGGRKPNPKPVKPHEFTPHGMANEAPNEERGYNGLRCLPAQREPI